MRPTLTEPLRLTALLAGCLAVCTALQAQNLFAEEEARWHLTHSYVNPNADNPTFTEKRTTVFYLAGDSVVSGDTWRAVHTRTDETSRAGSVFEGLLRSSGDVVLYRTAGAAPDTLYDFSLEAGDYFIFPFEGDTVPVMVAETDVIEFGGEMRKRIIFAEPESIAALGLMNEVWIEGVGSVHGPLFPLAPRLFRTEFADGLDLTCTEAGGESIWKNPDFSECFVSNVLNTGDKDDAVPFSVYPNPFVQEVYLEGPFLGGSGAEVRVYDMQGRKVYGAQLPMGKRQLTLNGLGTGVYLLEISWQGESYFQKIVK